jgi:hypothetical protein
VAAQLVASRVILWSLKSRLIVFVEAPEKVQRIWGNDTFGNDTSGNDRSSLHCGYKVNMTMRLTKHRVMKTYGGSGCIDPRFLEEWFLLGCYAVWLL